MPKLFKNKDHHGFAKLITEMVFGNPFSTERHKLQAHALGMYGGSLEADWNLDPRDKRRHEIMWQIHQQLKPLLDSLVAGYFDGHGDAGERELYHNLVVMNLYLGYRDRFDALIQDAHVRGLGKRRIAFYSEFLREFVHYFGKEDLPITPEHLFACCFQIRRAFYHIFHFFVGTTVAATRLRSRIWNSIFTHDLLRWQRSLYRRMAAIPTLITGPSGSGKELVARAIGFSQYAGFDASNKVFTSDFTKGFFPINLSALSPTLIESELFGHRKGAFTGALEDREGYFSACGPEGAVFLDEIGDTDRGIQVKLLRVLQTRQYQRLGDVNSETFHGKIIAATNCDLSEGIHAGNFREDLYFRLRSDVIHTLSLVELLDGEEGELAFLSEYAAGKLAGEDEAVAVSRDSLKWAEAHPGYPWPGNFRELEQAIRSILVHGEYNPPAAVATHPGNLLESLAASGLSLTELTRTYVQALYKETPVYEEVARKLKVDRRTVKKYLSSDC